MLATSIEKLPPEPRRQHITDHGLGVFQHYCESLRAPEGLYELMAFAMHKGEATACPQGVSEWVNYGYHFSPLNRSEPRQKDGCMIVISTKFVRTQIRCVHHWMLGRNLGVRLKCGEGFRAGDVYVISAFALVHDERTQTVTSDSLRTEIWRKWTGVIRQIPNRCRVILCIDANGELYTTLTWIGSAGNLSAMDSKWI